MWSSGGSKWMTIVHVVDVEAAGGDVGGDEGLELAGAEALAAPSPAACWRQVAVDGGRLDALLAEAVGQLVGVALGAGEEDRAVGAWRRCAAATLILSSSCTSEEAVEPSARR